MPEKAELPTLLLFNNELIVKKQIFELQITVMTHFKNIY